MKLLLLIVSAISVFDANCRNFLDPPDFVKEPDYNDSDDKHLHVPIEIESHDTSKTTHQQKTRWSHATDESEESNDLGRAKENYKLDQEEKGENGRKMQRSQCKAKSICVVMGGSCITNSTLCSGRIVPKQCKGQGCLCCVPESLKNQMHNITKEIKSLQKDLKDNTGTLENKIHDLENEIQSMQTNLNDTTFNVNLKLKHMEDNITDSISNISLNLQHTDTVCSESDGFFTLPETGQCFKVFLDTQRNWQASDQKCKLHSPKLELAKPFNALALRIYVHERYGSLRYWVGAKGSGSIMKWMRDNRELEDGSNLWWPGQPSSKLTDQCLHMTANFYNMKSQPTKPYVHWPCSSHSLYALCEMVMN